MSSTRTVSEIGNQIKALFESRQWPALGDCLQLSSIWYVYQPMSLPEALAMASQVLHDAQEVELTLLRIVRTSSSETHSRGSYQCRLGWFEPGALKQQEVSFDLHLGFQLKPEVKLEFLGITEASPEPSLPEAPEEAASPREEAPAIVPASVGGAPPAPTAGGAEAEVTVYVPVQMPASAVQARLRKTPGS